MNIKFIDINTKEVIFEFDQDPIDNLSEIFTPSEAVESEDPI